MAEHNELGKIGEDEALLYMMEKGYTLHDHNWRDGHHELDIVAEWFGMIIFVEVKTRRDEYFAPAVTAVDMQKKRFLISAARAWLARHHRLKSPYRYDIITVIGRCRPFVLTHYKNAFTETEVRRWWRRRNYDPLRV